MSPHRIIIPSIGYRLHALGGRHCRLCGPHGSNLNRRLGAEMVAAAGYVTRGPYEHHGVAAQSRPRNAMGKPSEKMRSMNRSC
jgi:hypothetical protein